MFDCRILLLRGGQGETGGEGGLRLLGLIVGETGEPEIDMVVRVLGIEGNGVLKERD